MADNSNPTASSSSSSAAAPPRPKPTRTGTAAGTVRGRTSPTGEQNGDGRPPTKRARKPINCEPCRNSKLKCDRNRPCSSCVLRGTSALCYQDGRGYDGNDNHSRGDDHHYGRIDPAQEITRLRHSINLLEAHILSSQRNHTSPHARPIGSPNLIPKKESIDHDVAGKPGAAPGILGSSGQGGLYAGATSALLMTGERASEESDSRQQSQDHTEEYPIPPEYDRDLLALLPSIEVIDELISFYFEYCNWIYRHVNQSSFTRHWARFKGGSSADRIILATACTMLAIATYYLPGGHSLLESFSETHEELGLKYYQVSTTALSRRLAESKAYSLELVEMYLIRGHYQSLSKNDSEEIWHIRGELISMGTAMGLHRDPGKWKMHRDIAERRRWAWWHIVLMERWQAFMFGRPLAIASHHFDTQLPSYCDPAVDKTGRLYLPNIALFRLCYILGDIMDDAVSVRPVPYESIQANDRALTQWMDDLPPELDLDEYRVARSLASPNTSVRRLGVQSVIIRTSYYHIRFTLHRPYVTNPAPSSGTSKSKSMDPAKSAQSLEIAVGAADKLITLVGQSRPDFLANSSLAVPGHMNWQPFHCFSAAMFFSFQLTANPDQPGAGLFRASIRKAMSTLEQSRGNAVADKALDILQALSPLYAVDFPSASQDIREKLRQQVLSTVRALAFPYHDSHDPRRASDSPSNRGISSPANSTSLSPPLAPLSGMPQQYDSMHAMSAMRASNSYPTHPTLQSPSLQMQSTMLGAPSHVASPPTQGYQSHTYNTMTHQQQMYPDSSRYTHYVQPMDDMWGAAVGFGPSEWTNFENTARHLQGT